MTDFPPLTLDLKMSFRKERKFRLSSSDFLKLKGSLFKKGMRGLYNERIVSSLYFDTLDFCFYRASEEGILPRRKVRVRWYDNNMEKLSIEKKISSIEGRFKTSNPLTEKEFQFFLNKGFFDKDYGLLRPVVKVSYNRAYFTFNKLRMTFDTSISYAFSSPKVHLNDSESVMEIKTSFNCDDDYIHSAIPIPDSRFSKYARSFQIRDKVL